jgi:hypothetical protein
MLCPLLHCPTTISAHPLHCQKPNAHHEHVSSVACSSRLVSTLPRLFSKWLEGPQADEGGTRRGERLGVYASMPDASNKMGRLDAPLRHAQAMNFDMSRDALGITQKKWTRRNLLKRGGMQLGTSSHQPFALLFGLDCRSYIRAPYTSHGRRHEKLPDSEAPGPVTMQRGTKRAMNMGRHEKWRFGDLGLFVQCPRKQARVLSRPTRPGRHLHMLAESDLMAVSCSFTH